MYGLSLNCTNEWELCLNCSIPQKERTWVTQMFQRCFACCSSSFVHQRKTCTFKLAVRKRWSVQCKQKNGSLNYINIFLSSVPAKHMIQGSKPPKTSRMKLSVSFDSTLLCIALSTHSLAGPCSHASEWTTPWLRSWWTECQQRMDSTRSCFLGQVRHTHISS